ncbi:MAG: serine hydrolase [Anaerolineaceae bacterium]|jgi:beta-lactamase class A
MRKKGSLIRWAALGLIVMASFLTILQLTRYAQIRATFPTGMTIAGIPIAGLEFEAASQRLVQVYMSPIELRYREAVIQIRPATLGFELQINNMLAAADKQRTDEPFWSGFWNYLWNRPMTTTAIPLQARYDEERIRAYLENEISIRYDIPATPPMPIPGESGFYPGKTGTAMDYDISVQRILDVLSANSNRSVNLEVVETRPKKPSFGILEIMLKDIIDEATFDGIVEFYFKDLQNGLVIHFTHSRIGEEELPTDIAFSSWSTIKIPALITLFKNLEAPYDQNILAEIEDMVEQSSNESTDSVAKKIIEPNLAPIRITEDMRALGLQNTFWAGFFSLGSPLLQEISTPANSQTDYDTDPDRYGQTSVLDMGLLLEEIYYCAQNYGGAIPLAFDGDITQEECLMMVDYLAKNKIGHLIEAGVPGGTIVAHKHGWANEVQDGFVHTMGDSAIVYTPGGDYILSIFVHQPVQVIFDHANLLFANLSASVYNYYNLQ